MSVISRFDPWQDKLCSCPEKFSLSPYTGCSHSCLYCYASSYIVNFFKPRPKKSFLPRLEKEIKKLPDNSLIAMANSSDPYQPIEKKLKLTRKTLEIIKNYPLKLTIVTKSDMVLRDLDILQKIKTVVCITLTTLNNSVAKKIEPKAALPDKRLETIKLLSKYLPVACRVDPLMPSLNTKEIEPLINKLKNAGCRQIITSTYKIKPDNFVRMIAAFPKYKKLWEDLYFKKGEKYGNYFYLPKPVRLELMNQVREYTSKQNMYFSSCREGMADLNTANCDGSSLFETTAPKNIS